jgi:hypothetical protein
MGEDAHNVVVFGTLHSNICNNILCKPSWKSSVVCKIEKRSYTSINDTRSMVV